MTGRRTKKDQKPRSPEAETRSDDSETRGTAPETPGTEADATEASASEPGSPEASEAASEEEAPAPRRRRTRPSRARRPKATDAGEEAPQGLLPLGNAPERAAEPAPDPGAAAGDEGAPSAEADAASAKPASSEPVDAAEAEPDRTGEAEPEDLEEAADAADEDVEGDEDAASDEEDDAASDEEDDAASDEEDDAASDDEADSDLEESPAGEAAEDETPDEDEAVDVDEPDEDAPAIKHDEDLDPAERAALEEAARDLEEEEEEAEPAGFAPDIPRQRLDRDALKVISRLHRFGHQTYLVGGCVRDLLLGLDPKDFDVATSAQPEETRSVFSNCRLIGRRFRLAHVYFRGGKVIETATFRANPHEDKDEPEDLYIEHDNVYGTAEQDAHRRDFTINGLFYDPGAGKVIDYVGGREDLERRVIRTIGEPDVRMQEDPVRILRAVRFAAKLDFAIDPATLQAMRDHVEEIRRSPPPRVLEEVLRLLRCGAARGAFTLLREIGGLEVLLPPLAEWLDAAEEEQEALFWAHMDAMDEWVHEHGLPDDSVLLAVLLSSFFSDEDMPAARDDTLDSLLANLVQDARLPRRKAERVRLILGAQRIFAGLRKRRFSVRRFVRQSYVGDALVLFDIRVRATGEHADELERWRHRVAEAPSSGPPERTRGRRRKRRPRRR